MRVKKVTGGRATVRMCLTMIWIGSVWTWGEVGEEGWTVRYDELGQTQRRWHGSKKTDYDENPRFLHSNEWDSLTSCARRDLLRYLPLHHLPLLLDEGRIQSVQNLLSTAGIEIAIENESETPTKTQP